MIASVISGSESQIMRIEKLLHELEELDTGRQARTNNCNGDFSQCACRCTECFDQNECTSTGGNLFGQTVEGADASAGCQWFCPPEAAAAGLCAEEGYCNWQSLHDPQEEQ